MAIRAKGVNFQVSISSVYTQILSVTEFALSGTAWDNESTTNHDSSTPVKTMQPTLRADGEVTLTLDTIPGDPVHEYLRTLSLNGSSNNFKIIYPGDTLGTFTFSGWVVSFAYETPVNGLMKTKVKITVDGAISDLAATLSVTVTDAFAGVYVTSNTLELTATYDETVVVTGTPRIAVLLGSGTVYATYASGSDSNVLKFHYTFGGGDSALATHFSVSSPAQLNSGTIDDMAAQAATLTFTPPTTTAFTVN